MDSLLKQVLKKDFDNVFYISLKTQYENLGDYLIAKASISYLQRYGRVILNVKDLPDKYLALFDDVLNVEYTKSGYLSCLLKNKKLIYIVKPGGYASHTTLKATFKRVLFLSYFLCSKIAGGKLIKLPHSNSINTCNKNRLEKIINNNIVNLLLVRDAITLDSYKKIGVDKAQYWPDMALYYAENKSEFTVTQRPKQNSQNLIFSFRFDRTDKRLDIIKKLVGMLGDSGINYKFLSQVKFDDSLNSEYSKSCFNTPEILCYKIDKVSINNIVEEYNKTNFVISDRLHVLILSAINGATPIALVDSKKDQKVIGCLESLGITNIVTYDDNKSLEEITDSIIKVMQVKNTGLKYTSWFKFDHKA